MFQENPCTFQFLKVFFNRNVSQKMKFAVLTLFPEMLDVFWNTGIIRRAVLSGLISGESVYIRDFASDRHKTCDDRPYGGGCGMVMKPEPLARALMDTKERMPGALTVLMSPQGKPFDQKTAEKMASLESLIIVCGRYEGIDERFVSDYVDEEISIGDYVLSGGEIGAMAVIDSISRLIPGVLGGGIESAELDTFSTGLIEHAHYTRPEIFEGQKVPDVLLSGNHKEIDKWRLESSLKRTFLKRPDLLENRTFTADEKAVFKKWREELKRLVSV